MYLQKTKYVASKAGTCSTVDREQLYYQQNASLKIRMIKKVGITGELPTLFGFLECTWHAEERNMGLEQLHIKLII